MASTRDAMLADPWGDDERQPDGFDVTCVIGRVEFGTGDEPPHVAAFKLIAWADHRGTFQFPMPDGRTMSVTVDYPDLP